MKQSSTEEKIVLVLNIIRMAKLFKKKNKKPEKIGENVVLETPEIIEDPRKEKKLSGSAELAAKINSIIRGK